MQTITLTEEQATEVRSMLNASIIRMSEWVKEARANGLATELEHLEAMRTKRRALQNHIVKQIPAKGIKQ